MTPIWSMSEKATVLSVLRFDTWYYATLLATWAARETRILAVIDGATGDTIGAVEIPYTLWSRELRQRHVASGTLWLEATGGGFLALDARTLRVTASTGRLPELRDVRDDFERDRVFQ
jgi:hypothetical protein